MAVARCANGDVIAVTNPANGEQLGSVPKMAPMKPRSD
ncbi:succinate-semialdehyde dehydrogenase I [Klebsiella pneumoniae]|uniref:Succinate-semialdehyde dehydrogenase I n=1 Tax=Klebsiella pneumoniae TaxID=573 RepID=A0A377ZHW2_KLEPN|nr:succinate-semialdehyde dehydrogenase I [Klebsiella pneumoniae]